MIVLKNILLKNKSYIFQTIKRTNSIKNLFNSAKSLIEETFMQESSKSRFEKNKIKFKELKKFSDEELEIIQSEIPEYKRTALTISSIKYEKTLREKLKDKLDKNITSDSDFKEMNEELENLSLSYKEFKDGLKSRVNLSDNYVFQTLEKLGDLKARLNFEETKAAIKYMREFDSSFELETIEADAKELFLEVMNAHLSGSDLNEIEYLSEGAIIYLSHLWAAMEGLGGTPYLNQVCYTSYNSLLRIDISKDSSKKPIFYIFITSHENDCLVDKEGNIVYGDKNSLKSRNYMIALEPDEELDILKYGHYWRIKAIERFGETKSLF